MVGKGTQPGHLESQEGDFGSLLLQRLWESESHPLPPLPPTVRAQGAAESMPPPLSVGWEAGSLRRGCADVLWCPCGPLHELGHPGHCGEVSSVPGLYPGDVTPKRQQHK